MRWITRLRLRLRSLLFAPQLDRDLDEELQYHVDRLIAEHLAAGLPAAEARYRALVEMGAITQRKEECRESRGLAWIGGLRQDAVVAVRALRKNAAFSVAAVLSLAIGIGANTTIFTLVNGVLLRPLPYPGSDRLVVLNERPFDSAKLLNVHPVSFTAWRARAKSFESMALVQSPPLNLMGPQGAEQIARMTTTEDLFRVFGVSPLLGRGFTGEETRPGAPRVVILGHGFWQRWFGGDPGVLGGQLNTQDGALSIVGVAPPGFRVGVIEPDAFTPMMLDPANPSATGGRAFDCYARLAPGVSLDAATAEMAVIAAAQRLQRSDQAMDVSVDGLHAQLVKDARPALRLLMAVVAIVLAIACANLAGLLTARGMARRTELAVRAALGASRARLIRQLVVESFMLSLVGGTLGVLIAYWATYGLVALSAGALTAGVEGPIQLDSRCLLFTCAMCAGTTLAFGLAPARHASRVDPQIALRDRTRGTTTDRRGYRIRSVLVIAQVALAVVLLIGAGLLLRTLSTLTRVNLGYDPSKALTMGLFLGIRPPETRMALLDQILDRIEDVPGVTAAGTIQFLPMRGMTCGTGFWTEDQAASQDPSRTLPTDCSLVSRGYLAAMGIPVMEGRPFDRRDRAGTPRVLLVNQAFANRYGDGRPLLGRKLFVQGSHQALAEVVGVVGDVRHNGLTADPAPTVFLLHAQTPGYITNLVVRTEGDPIAHASAIRRAIHDVDPTQAVSGVRRLDDDVAQLLARPRLQAGLVTCFAVIAAALASLGVYGLIAYTVAQRTQEIGIRLALGASRARVVGELLTQGSRLVVAGLVSGIVLAFTGRGIVTASVFGVSAGDPLTYVMAVAVFSVAALAAVVIPARRASRVEPMQALRCE